MRNRELRRIAVVLGLMTAIGPTAIDLYLPAFPAIAHGLHTDGAAVQMSLVSFFAALAVGQLFYGPLADMHGRKRPLYAGLALFAAGSIFCAVAPDIGTLIVARFIQGLGACCGIAMARAIVRDLRTGADAAGLMATIALISSVSPILAPMIGSAILVLFAWRSIFWLIAASCGILALIVSRVLPETHPADRRQSIGWRPTIRAYRSLLGDRRFLGLSAANGLILAISFGFLAGAPYVYATSYGLRPWQFGGVLALNGAVQIGCAQLVPHLLRRVSAMRLIWAVAPAVAIDSLVLMIVAQTGVDSIGVVIALVAIAYAGVGLLLAPLTVTLMEPRGHAAGSASALLGVFQLATGAGVSALVSIAFDGSVRPMAYAIAICAVFALPCLLLGQSSAAPRKANS